MGSRIAIFPHNPVTKSSNIFVFNGFFPTISHDHAPELIVFLGSFRQANIVYACYRANIIIS